MANGELGFSKEWAIKCDHEAFKVGQVVTVNTKNGPKRVRITDVVVRSTMSGKAYDLLFTVDVD